MKELIMIILISLFVSVAGCYNTGRKFETPNLAVLKLKQTTMKEIKNSYGEPNSYSSFESNNKKVDQIQYSYHTASGYASGKGPVGRQATFYFCDGTLIGYLYRSSFESDSTDFDISNVKQITEGTSTRKDVETIFGQPTGIVLFPLVNSQDGTELRYYYVGPKGAFATGGIVSKQLSAIIDGAGIVQKINTSEKKE
jgi:hypothetical protein